VKVRGKKKVNQRVETSKEDARARNGMEKHDEKKSEKNRAKLLTQKTHKEPQKKLVPRPSSPQGNHQFAVGKPHPSPFRKRETD